MLQLVWADLGLLIAATEGSLPGLPAPAQYGILGIAVVVLASAKVVVPVGWLNTERENTKIERARGDRLEEEIRRLNSLMAEKTIPALTDSTNAVKEVALIIHDTNKRKEL